MDCNRTVTVVVGLAAGSEGKGKIVSKLAPEFDDGALVRTGGPNAAHTVIWRDQGYAFHQIPCGALHAPKAKLVFGAGAQIDIEVLNREIEILKKAGVWSEDRLIIDPQATIIDQHDKIAENGGQMPLCGDDYHHPRDCSIHNHNSEELSDLVELSPHQDEDGSRFVTPGGTEFGFRYTDKHAQLANKKTGTCLGCPALPAESAWAKIGSTTHGAGANMIRKARRNTKMVLTSGEVVRSMGERRLERIDLNEVKLAAHVTELHKYIVDGSTASFLNKMVDDGRKIMVEGTQGAMLSLHHAYYPYCTSRDTNVSNWLMEAGLSPFVVERVVGVTRTFPIRVAGNSGPMSGKEVTWDEVTESAKSDRVIEEVTTATKRRRRVFLFGVRDFELALAINRPNCLALTFVDYLSASDYGKSRWNDLSKESKQWIVQLEARTGCFFDFLSTGPNPEHTIARVQANRQAA